VYEKHGFLKQPISFRQTSFMQLSVPPVSHAAFVRVDYDEGTESAAIATSVTL
jgi:serine protease inhibitor